MMTTPASTQRAASRVGLACLVIVSAGALCAGAVTHYVDRASPAPVPPFTNWFTAATAIQDAVDAANNGATILVNTGVYAAGGALTPGFALSNRVVATQAVTIASVGGPAVTFIAGARDPASDLGLGSNAVRGVFLSGGAELHGFTISNGATFAIGAATGNAYLERSGGGIYIDNAAVSNCIVVHNAAGNYGGAIFISNWMSICAVQASSNWAFGYGGGIAWQASGTLCDSLIHGNVVSNNDGGGVCAAGPGLISNCVISGNLCQKGGAGGVLTQFARVELVNCLIRGNACTLGRGGGMYLNAGGAVVNNCIFEGNAIFGGNYGGGAYVNSGRINNSLFWHNYAKAYGGGMMTANAKINNCTIISNRTDYALGAGGVYLSGLQTVMRNSIVYHNTAAGGTPNYILGAGSGSITCTFVCTVPAFVSDVNSTNYSQYGEGTITNEPQFVDLDAGNCRLFSGSPCINAGSNEYASGSFDLDGTARIKQGIVDMGAYEAVPEPALVAPLFILLSALRCAERRHDT